MRLIYLVTSGRIDLVRHTGQGATLILKQAKPENVLAEASVYSEEYHCDAVAKVPSQLKAVSAADFHENLHNSRGLTIAWAAHLAAELQRTRMESEIRSLNTVAEKLDAWLATNEGLPPRGKVQDLASILGVSREALYRELAQRRT